MDAIKKKMEKLANETNEAEMRFSPPLYSLYFYFFTVVFKNKFHSYSIKDCSLRRHQGRQWTGGFSQLITMNIYCCHHSHHWSSPILNIRVPAPTKGWTFFSFKAEKYEDQLKNVQKKIQVNRKLYITIVLWRFTKEFLYSCKCHKDDLLYMLYRKFKT